MADQIRIAYETLGAVADTALGVAQDLKDVRRPDDVDLSASPATRRGYTEFESAWDKRRDEISGALEVVGEALAGIAQVFEEADMQMAGALRGEGGPS